MVRRFSLHYNGSFKRVSPDEIGQRLAEKGLLPLVELPYDQSKLNLVKNEIKKIYKEKGIAVDAESVLNSTNTPRYVEVFIEVYKL
jgi:D-alanine-D-alanine ligase-like ATP-grasp enzyme